MEVRRDKRRGLQDNPPSTTSKTPRLPIRLVPIRHHITRVLRRNYKSYLLLDSYWLHGNFVTIRPSSFRFLPFPMPVYTISNFILIFTSSKTFRGLFANLG